MRENVRSIDGEEKINRTFIPTLPKRPIKSLIPQRRRSPDFILERLFDLQSSIAINERVKRSGRTLWTSSSV